MINEIPFPMPLSVTCSPIHIRNMVPAVRVITVMTRKAMPGSGTKGPILWMTWSIPEKIGILAGFSKLTASR